MRIQLEDVSGNYNSNRIEAAGLNMDDVGGVESVRTLAPRFSIGFSNAMIITISKWEPF